MLTALVLGGASGVWADAEAAIDMFTPELVIAVNDIGAQWAGRITHWVTLHPEHMPRWRAKRADQGLKAAEMHIGHELKDGIDRAVEYRFPKQSSSGSSGLFAVKVAVDEGCTRIVLAGIPMSADGGHIGDGRIFRSECHEYRKAWEEALPAFKDVTTSMSGWTAARLGMPTREWLRSDD